MPGYSHASLRDNKSPADNNGVVVVRQLDDPKRAGRDALLRAPGVEIVVTYPPVSPRAA